jgi:hypothetical protein
MNIESKYKIKDISKCLVDTFKAQEITLEEFLSFDSNIPTTELNNKSKIYKISDSNFIQSLLSENEKSEIQITVDHLNKNIGDIDCLSYEYQISIGKLIVIILESKDGDNLSSFIMDGNGQLLFNYLSKLIGDDIEKNDNPLDEVIEELNHFKPYGKYFK